MLEDYSFAKPAPWEVIVVDDGSTQPLPVGLRYWRPPFTFRIMQQLPMGIAAARNAGMRSATGDIILFTDSDCLLEPDCLSELARFAAAFPDDEAFQLALRGADDHLVGCIEGLRLCATQEILRMANGHLCYVNTSGFAVRRHYAMQKTEFFNVGAIRGADTYALAVLCEDGLLPRFIPTAQVKHRPPLTPYAYLFKHFFIGYHTSPARRKLSQSGNVIMQWAQRKRVLSAAWHDASERPFKQLAFFFLLVAYAFELCGRVAYSFLGMHPGKVELFGVDLDCLHAIELQARVLSAAHFGHSKCVTYLTAWSLVQLQRNSEFRSDLNRFDICYADGMGVVLSLWLLRRRRIRKVTANDFFFDLCRKAAQQQLRIALIGAEKWVLDRACKKLTALIPPHCLVLSSSGYLSEPEEEALVKKLVETRPHLVFVGMGQPLQERFVLKLRATVPKAVFFCVGGLFDYIAGLSPAPPGIIRRFGLEWLFRLMHSPRRLWKRYILGIPLLGGYIMREYVTHLRSFLTFPGIKLSSNDSF